MNIEDLAQLTKLVSNLFTEEACNQIFGEHGPRLWSKHWGYHCNNDFILFNKQLEFFNNGKYAYLRPNLDIWLTDIVETSLSPLGYRLVKIE